jgi:indolepyruvate ferredoxin oxidoreductase, beta subunit
MKTTKNIMIVGVGGQGTLLTSRILGRLATAAGYDVKLSEVHGMAQRGGSVVTFVRYGEKVAEPIVEVGQADVLIAFERLEALRYLHYLQKRRRCGCQRFAHRPPLPSLQAPPNIRTTLSARFGRLAALSPFPPRRKQKSSALRAPSTWSCSARLPVTWALRRKTGFAVIEATVPPKTVEINKKAFETGYALSV